MHYPCINPIKAITTILSHLPSTYLGIRAFFHTAISHTAIQGRVVRHKPPRLVKRIQPVARLWLGRVDVQSCGTVACRLIPTSICGGKIACLPLSNTKTRRNRKRLTLTVDENLW